MKNIKTTENPRQTQGYVVAIVDNTNKGVEAQYWTDDFLHIRQRKELINVCKKRQITGGLA